MGPMRRRSCSTAEEYYNITPNEGTHTHTTKTTTSAVLCGQKDVLMCIILLKYRRDGPRTRFPYDRKCVSTAATAIHNTVYYVWYIVRTNFFNFFCGQWREVHAKKFSWYAAVVLPFYFYDPCVSKTVVVFVVWCWSSSSPCLLWKTQNNDNNMRRRRRYYFIIPPKKTGALRKIL